MPEGPSIINYVSGIKYLEGQKVTDCGGYAPMDRSHIPGEILLSVKSHGKNFIFQFRDFFVTVHLGLFGRLLLNGRKKVNASFSLHFEQDELNFYVSKVKRFEGVPEDLFDAETDVMSAEFNPEKVLRLLQENYKEALIGDVLLDQNVFAGSGNIIRNEALYRSKIHPESRIVDVPARKLKELIAVTRDYSFEFLNLLQKGGVKKKAQIYAKTVCPAGHTEIRRYKPGKVKRNTFVCEKCQKRY